MVPTDDAFVNAVSTHVRKCANEVSAFSHMYVETAGGMRLLDHSDTLHIYSTS